MSFKEERLEVKIFVSIVILAAALLLALHNPLNFLSLPLVFFIGLNLLLENMDVTLPHNKASVSVGFATNLAMILLFGPGPAAWGSFATILHKRTWENRKDIHKPLFNVAQVALAAAGAGYAYQFFGGITGQLVLLRDFYPIVMSILSFSLINIMLVMGIFFLTQKKSFFSIWLIVFRWAIPNYLAIAPLGILIAAIYTAMGISAIVLLMIPLMLARHTFILYMEMRNQYISTIKALTKAIDAKDHYTHGHSERVAEYAVAIAAELKLPEDFQEKLEYLALMHDIGKISIPETILNKPTRLSNAEFELIRSHPEIGAEIIKNIKLIGEYADIVRHHHEWVDGSGYPCGITGEKISLGARIMSVADAFDAMTSARIYSTPKSKQQAVAELERCCHTQFCQDVVQAFVKVLRRRGEIS
ncbi:MAG: HD-GYP domain-containing protein [Firmicutes bacterium]|nr:HD-GYP domain-containing protein [Bacillota bacterium]MCL5993851.1 HD-GYP domain-containing protein [Bacillota bacterium]